MNSPGNSSSPTYRNLRIRNKQSPIEIKEKLRKSYREKVHNCRNLLFNSLRGPIAENDVRNTLDEIYSSMFNWTGETTSDEEQIVKEIREELVTEELNWCIEEYEKCQNDIDWNSLETENVICPVCQKENFIIENGGVLCKVCNFSIKTDSNVLDIKKSILHCMEKHSASCSYEPQFTAVPDGNNMHIYLVCASCNDMQIII